MERYLVTHSLLSSWLYAMKEDTYGDATTQKNPIDEFLTVLRREPTPTNEAMQKGIDFENLVMSIVRGKDNVLDKWYTPAKEIADIVRGGVFQYVAKREARVKNRDVLLYGRLDVLKSGVIYDIKFSGGYDVGRYIDSTQHPMYLHIVPEAREFSYLVSNGTNAWEETYTRDDSPDILRITAQFFDWLSEHNLDQTYRQFWLSR